MKVPLGDAVTASVVTAVLLLLLLLLQKFWKKWKQRLFKQSTAPLHINGHIQAENYR